MNVVQALAAVMGDVQGIRKGDRNTEQGFNYRGIDAVINAVGPALRTHGVVVVPIAEDITTETYTTKKGTVMRNVTVKVVWTFYGPEGDSISAATYGEASDAGDKAVSKAHSVAYRTCLLQVLCIPTDEPDPDASSYERKAPPAGRAEQVEPEPAPTASMLRVKIARASDLSPAEIGADFASWSNGQQIGTADAGILAEYLTTLGA